MPRFGVYGLGRLTNYHSRRANGVFVEMEIELHPLIDGQSPSATDQHAAEANVSRVAREHDVRASANHKGSGPSSAATPLILSAQFAANGFVRFCEAEQMLPHRQQLFPQYR